MDEIEDRTDSSLPQLNNENDQIPSPLSRIPIDIAHHRNQLFHLETPVQFDQAAWTKYWPFIDNVWCLHNRQDAPASLASGNVEKFWGGCRLQRKWNHGEANPSGRKRTRRETGQCPAKFRLTYLPNGIRILERNKEPHSHDLDHIDSIKRNSGIRALVTDPFFTGWDSGPILAYLKDPANRPASTPDLLTDAGGKYLERREIINIFSQHLKKAYPGLDVAQVKKQRDRYEGVKTCNFKGCNMSFRSGKELTAHRKVAHKEKKHDHSARLYTCPSKACHRHKRSKGLPSLEALREHQIRMGHWGSGTYHGDESGQRSVHAVTEADTVAAENGETAEGGNLVMSMQQPLPHGPPDLPIFPKMPGPSLGAEDDHIPIDPSIQNMHHTELSMDNGQTRQQRQEMLHRLRSLEMEQQMMEQEIERLRNAVYAG